MREKEPQFTVTDRRKFTSDGALREGAASATESTPAPVASPVATATAPAAAPVETADAPHIVDALFDQQAPAEDVSPEEVSEETEFDESIPEPTAAESAQQSKDYSASSHRLNDMFAKANPGQAMPPAMNFDRLVQSLYMTAAVQMGAGAAGNEQPRIDILGARQSIDMLIVLEEKTRGNLTEQEKRLLQNALFDLRMSFLEITNAIASSAQRPPQSSKLH